MTDLQDLQRRMGFAGSPAAVAAYQAFYLDWFPRGGRVLDVGCGEGVFLDLLKARGFRAVGIDSSAGEIARAQAKSHDVFQSDALEFLRAHPAEFDGIFCAHLIEHLPPTAAVELIEAGHAALRPQGVLVLITPDPLDLEVLTERFWLDLTHVRPYPLALLSAMVRELGFEIVASGNDPRSARGTSLFQLPRRLARWLRFGRHSYRGDTFVIARRRAGPGA